MKNFIYSLVCSFLIISIGSIAEGSASQSVEADTSAVGNSEESLRALLEKNWNRYKHVVRMSVRNMKTVIENPPTSLHVLESMNENRALATLSAILAGHWFDSYIYDIVPGSHILATAATVGIPLWAYFLSQDVRKLYDVLKIQDVTNSIVELNRICDEGVKVLQLKRNNNGEEEFDAHGKPIMESKEYRGFSAIIELFAQQVVYIVVENTRKKRADSISEKKEK